MLKQGEFRAIRKWSQWVFPSLRKLTNFQCSEFSQDFLRKFLKCLLAHLILLCIAFLWWSLHTWFGRNVKFPWKLNKCVSKWFLYAVNISTYDSISFYGSQTLENFHSYWQDGNQKEKGFNCDFIHEAKKKKRKKKNISLFDGLAQ